MARLRNDRSLLDPARCLPLGLAFLHRLVLAATPKERRRLLSTPLLSYEVFFLNWACLNRYDLPPLSEMNEEEQQRWIIPATVCDGDDGPEAAWRWAYGGHGRASWFKSSTFTHLRRWGFVMWDYNRLNGAGVFDMDPFSLERLPNEDRLVDAMMACVLGTNVTTLVDSGRS